MLYAARGELSLCSTVRPPFRATFEITHPEWFICFNLSAKGLWPQCVCKRARALAFVLKIIHDPKAWLGKTTTVRCGGDDGFVDNVDALTR